jgi:hypothetical protein
MATLEEIRNRVIRIAQDAKAYSPDSIDELINEGLLRCASRVLLPDLEKVMPFSTEVGKYVVNIPTLWNFNNNLFLCRGPNQTKPEVLSSVSMLARKYPEFRFELETGDIQAITTTQTQILYYPIPETIQVYTCAFYQKPTKLTTDSSVPSILPESLHYALLASYAAAVIWGEKEDGIDGFKINTLDYRKQFETAIDELKELVKTGQSRPEPSRDKDWI